MRGFLCSMLLLALMLTGIAVNFLYINRVADELNRRLDALPTPGADDCPEQLAALSDYWEEATDWVSLSVSYPILDRVSEQIVTLVACESVGDVFGYRTALALLRDAIGDMRRLERFSIENLL